MSPCRSRSRGSLSDDRPLFGRLLPVLGFGLLIGFAAMLLLYGDAVSGVRDDLRASGAAGVGLYIAMHVLWTLTTVPTIPLMSVAGVVYGPWAGTAYALIGGAIGFAATFGIGKTLLPGRVARWSERHRSLARVMRVVERHEALSVLVVRLVPVFPLNLMGYGFGATSMRFRRYMLLSLLAFLPGAALYAGLGELLWRSVANGRTPVSATMLIWVGVLVVFSAALGYAVTRLYRRAAHTDSGEDEDCEPARATASARAPAGGHAAASGEAHAPLGREDAGAVEHR